MESKTTSVTKIEVNETERTYFFPDGSRYPADGAIHDVKEVDVRSSGNHRILCKDWTKHIVRAGWNGIMIKE